MNKFYDKIDKIRCNECGLLTDDSTNKCELCGETLEHISEKINGKILEILKIEK